MRELRTSEGIAVISSMGIVAWIISDFYGGMILWWLSLMPFVTIFIIIYLVSIIDLVVSIIKKGKYVSKVKVSAHSLVVLAVLFLNVYHSDLFKSRCVLSALLVDDLYGYTLIFREDGRVENHVNGMLGYNDVYNGQYCIEGDLIIFEQVPYENDFIPDTLLLSLESDAIFLTRDKSGNFNQEKSWLNHFVITEYYIK